MTAEWTPASWRTRPAVQQPSWPSSDALSSAFDQISGYPPLVFAGEIRRLERQLTKVARGKALLLQAGDCAESFDAFNAISIRERLRVILQMAVVLTYSAGVPVVKVGRMAGQFAKPRSSDTEIRGDVELPSFRGHIVNSPDFDDASRVPDPRRLLGAYNQSAATLNLVRAFTKGGFADLSRVHQWNQEFTRSSPAGEQYESIADEIDRAISFMNACGLRASKVPQLRETNIYTTHEALILEYEEALTRTDSLTGKWYDCSAHMLWIGERTRQIDGAHFEFARGINNPIGCKVGVGATPDDVVDICQALNPERIPGRLTLITRMGAEHVTAALPPLIEACRKASHPVVWACDPMHGNTVTAPSGLKTRRFDDVITELRGFFAVHKANDSWPGGVHIELTGDDVTECTGGPDGLSEADLPARYETICDPRLNARQSINLAFLVADLLR